MALPKKASRPRPGSVPERYLGADPEDLGRLLANADAGMAHAAVEIDRVPGAEDLLRIELGEDLDRAAEHEDEFFSIMADPAAEFLEGPGHDLGAQRKDLLVLQVRGQGLVEILVGRQLLAHMAAGDAAARRR